MAQLTNIEVQVALLRAHMHKKDLAKLLDMDEKTFRNRFYNELPQDLQERLIKLIQCVAYCDEPTQEDLENYRQCCDQMKRYSDYKQEQLNERTIAFVEFIEKNGNREQQYIDELSEKFNINKDNQQFDF
ncbi:MAG: hypothetical protein IIZ94_14420 [Prevotella sp.]|nr:hypothetical protein [Prevotella sp.]